MMKRILIVLATAAAIATAQTIDERHPVEPTDTLEVYNVAGEVKIAAWDNAEVHVTGTLGRNTERVDVVRDERRTIVKVIVPKNARNVGRTDLVIMAPAQHRIHISLVSSAAIIENIKGDIDASSVSGSVRITGAAGDVRAKSVSGAVVVEGEIQDCDAESVSGSVSVKTVYGEATAKSVSGSVRVHGASPSQVECQSMSGSIEYKGGLAPDGEIEARSHSGGVLLQLPADVSAEVEAETFSGSIRNSISNVEPVQRRGPGSYLNTTFGSGTGRIEAESFSGSVTFAQL